MWADGFRKLRDEIGDGIGDLNAAFYPLAMGALRFCSADLPRYIFRSDEKLGLPRETAVLIRGDEIKFHPEGARAEVERVSPPRARIERGGG
ncbi:hypothetical protein DRP77_04885 [Candidatus Poribacteria bacterium]|nr:MAG: hypothetical protein DRP77_04885 [Candidatus Poribacteria bacterium]